MRATLICFMLLSLLSLFVTGSEAQTYTYIDLYNFWTNSGDPAEPAHESLIAQGRDGSLYSTSPTGGSSLSGLGTVFKITPAGVLTVLYRFDSTHGSTPTGGLTLGADGNLYGTTTSGGDFDNGTVFKITPAGSLTVLHSFNRAVEGYDPSAAPIQARDGNFYGTTFYGGTNNLGTVYKVTPAGNLSTLYSFDSAHGTNHQTALVEGLDGNLYGLASEGGASGYGTAYKITRTGQITTLYSFDFTHGAEPLAALALGRDGNFYGTTTGGGSDGIGTIFKITSTGALTVLYSFNFANDGSGPYAGVAIGTDNNFYGTTQSGGVTCGTLFKLSPQGQYSIVYTFMNATGCTPEVTLLQHTNGIFYGDTLVGGSQSLGVVYSFNANQRSYIVTVSKAARAGATVGILGQGFTSATIVAFNGVSAQFTIKSNSFLTTVVPSGATTGFVTVGTSRGTLSTKQKFVVLP